VNSKRKCGGCSQYFRPEQTFPGTVAWCSPDCGLIVAGKRTITLKRSEKAVERKESREAVQRLKDNDKSHQMALTKREAQRLGNLLDKVAGFGCISCETEKPDIQYCGGHFKTAGGNPEIALDIRNISRQCNVYCNQHLSGNINGTKNSKGYKSGLIDRYGPAYVEWLESYHEPKKYTCEDLKELRKVYAAEIRRLKAGEKPSRNWREL